MATTFEHFKNKIILRAELTAQDGRADKVKGLLKAIQANVLAGGEPGCLTFRISREGNQFLVFEEYANAEAVKVHMSLPNFQAFANEVKTGTLLIGGPKTAFYEEV